MRTDTIHHFTYDDFGWVLKDDRGGYWGSMSYVYSADGRKLRTTHSRKSGNRTSTTSDEYCDMFIFKYGEISTINFPGGYYAYDDVYDQYELFYYIQDYQGNNRMAWQVPFLAQLPGICRYVPCTRLLLTRE